MRDEGCGGLNAGQRTAASHEEGPALVLAGPGTGKTTALAGRYGVLVERGVDPREILVATFTRKAAAQLRARLAGHTGAATEPLPIGTFHALCLRLLREDGARFGLPGPPRLISEGQQFRLLRELQLDWPGDLEDLRDAIARCKDRLVTPDQARRDARRGPLRDRGVRLQVAEAYSRYQEALGRAGWLDFGDLLATVVHGARSQPELRDDLVRRFQHLLVDEYQDINPAQDALLRLLLTPQRNLWVVGDDDQAIYGWRGSDAGYIGGFSAAFPGAAVYRLEQNYRSPRVVIELANRLIGHNRNRLEKTLRPTRPAVTQVVLCRAADERREAAWVVRALQVLLARGMAPGAAAILVRTRFQTLPFETALRGAGVPFVIRGGPGFWELKEVQTLLEALWHRTTPPPPEPCPWSGLAYLRPRLAGVAADHRERPFPALVAALAEAVAAAAPVSATDERALQWAGAARQVAAEAQGFADADAFFAHVRGSAAAPSDTDADAVVLSTIHQAKGLEWDAVFVCGCETGLLPHEKAEDLEEERRLAFVAATRARRYLSLSCCETRAERPVAPPPFLAEMTREAPPEALSWRRWPPPAEEEVTCWLGERPVAEEDPVAASRRPRAAGKRRGGGGVRKGVRVFHTAFGSGVVQRVSGEKWTVRFPKHGEKTILAGYLRVVG